VKFTVAFGRVDALAALQYLGAVDSQPASLPVQTAAPQLYYELNGWTSLAPLSGSPEVGQVLVRGIGGWAGSTGLAVSNLQWQRCDPAGVSCVYVTNQSTYPVQSADSGSTIKLSFTVSNPLGSVPVAVLSQLVGGTTTTTTTTTSAPASSSPPTISGTPQSGQTLTASTGSWSGSPTSYIYRWQDCDSSGANCASISGATAASYAAQDSDVGHTLRAVVTAANSAGSTAATSAPTAVVAATPSTAPPSTPSTQTTTFSGALNPQNPSRTFTVTVGAGSVHASLTFSKCNSLALSLSNGASNSGSSVLTLDSTVAAGTYTYSVAGGKCSFALAVIAPTP
jgi:hypothetical protein